MHGIEREVDMLHLLSLLKLPHWHDSLLLRNSFITSTRDKSLLIYRNANLNNIEVTNELQQHIHRDSVRTHKYVLCGALKLDRLQ